MIYNWQEISTCIVLQQQRVVLCMAVVSGCPGNLAGWPQSKRSKQCSAAIHDNLLIGQWQQSWPERATAERAMVDRIDWLAVRYGLDQLAGWLGNLAN